MKKKYVKFLMFAFLFVFNFAFSIPGPPDPSYQRGGPGGVGGDADQVTTPIDMYMIPLVFLAVMLIFFYAKKRSAKVL